MVWCCKRKYNDKTLTLRKSVYIYTSERRKFSHFHILKLPFLSIFCWYFRYFVGTNDMLVGLHVPTNFQMYQRSSEKAFMHGGGRIPPPPPPGYASASPRHYRMEMAPGTMVISETVKQTDIMMRIKIPFISNRSDFDSWKDINSSLSRAPEISLSSIPVSG